MKTAIIEGVAKKDAEFIKTTLKEKGYETEIKFLKRAIITGITGQDAAYLAEFLLSKNYEVYGTFRRNSSMNFWRIDELGIRNHKNLHLVEFDLTDPGAAIKMLQDIEPDEIYNLAAQSFVAVSFKQPYTTTMASGVGALNLLEAIRLINPKIKFYQASTSEMFGKVQQTPQTESTPFHPRSPYGVAKLFAHWATINYRESYGIFGCCGILFNHESPLRGIEFVTRKITDGVAKIKLGQQEILELGNLSALRDWGFAKDYIEGMYLMMQKELPSEYVLSTGRTTSVRDFVIMSFKVAGISVASRGQGDQEELFDIHSGKVVVRVNPDFYRPAEVDLLIGNPEKAYRELGWQAKTSLEELCKIMVEKDLERNSRNENYKNVSQI